MSKINCKVNHNRTKAIIIILIVIIAIFLIGLVMCLSQSKGKIQFDSEEEMRSSLQGAWTICFNDGESTGDQLIIDGDLGKLDIDGVGIKYSQTIEWEPNKGILKWDDTIYIVDNNTLKSSDRIYKRGTVEKTTYDFEDWDSSKNTTEKLGNDYTMLQVSNVKIESDTNYTVCTGIVTNNGRNTYKFIEVKGAFKTSNGTVVDTDSSYACGNEGLDVGESTSFRLSVPKNDSITSCDVNVFDYAIK